MGQKSFYALVDFYYHTENKSIQKINKINKQINKLSNIAFDGEKIIVNSLFFSHVSTKIL